VARMISLSLKLKNVVKLLMKGLTNGKSYGPVYFTDNGKNVEINRGPRVRFMYKSMST
jgi:hypothetical protein